MLMNSQITRMNNGFPLTDTHTAVKSKKAEGVLFFKDFISNIRSSENTAAGSADDKIKPHKYKKLEKVMKAETGKALLQGKNKRVGDHVTGSKIEKTETGVSDSQKADLILDYLAQVLGVNAGELAKLLESAGIKPGELASISQSDTLETKLTQA
ncbi:MAG: hypothetical protein FIA99_01505, partial [Ruminiclostridium sp.]|nr:hypothetical protein [Ruminiclostridium sp.]